MTPLTPDQDELSPRLPYPVVAIGSSAGGLEAMQELLSHLGADTGMAFIYIQHLDPIRKSLLTQILQRSTKMSVFEAGEDMALCRDSLYVIPPDKDILLSGGVLKLIPRPAKPAIHLPIDMLFASLADDQKEAAIGVILSGNANDGTHGLQCLKLAGGITIVQDISAKFDGMPAAAIAAGDVDMVLSPAKIAAELRRIGQHPEIALPENATDEKNTDETSVKNNAILREIIGRLQKETGVDFPHYKLSTIRRRITRRLLIYRLNGLQEYLDYILVHPEEIHILYQDVLINVTSFFRDADTVELTKKNILPGLVAANAASGELRIWIPGCSSGEEAYSLAILVLEVLGNRADQMKIQIFGTDLSESCIAKARSGIYTPNELEHVSEQRLSRFFEPVEGNFRIVKTVRDSCIFAVHNVLGDPPFSRMDMVSCCNVMIYLDNALQKRLLSVIHYSLKEKGILIMGKSESTISAPALFNQLDKRSKLFRKVSTHGAKQSFEVFYNNRIDPTIAPKTSQTGPFITMNTIKTVQAQTDELLLSRYIPACLIINIHLEIIQFRGPASHFIEPSQGKASLNLLKMVKPALGFEIRHLVNKSHKTGESLSSAALTVKLKTDTYNVVIGVTPLPVAPSDEPVFCITLQETRIDLALLPSSGDGNTQIIQDMQKELERAKEEMHEMMEGRDANVEALQSANEEIISSNEELQTINEELETSKEEVESANEELQSINKELQLTNKQLVESNEYAEAVFETIGEAVLVLNADFRIKIANAAFYNIFRSGRSETEGQLLFDLGTGQWDIFKIRKQLKAVLSGAPSLENLEIEKEFPGVGYKVVVLNARRIRASDSTYLIILAIKDISEHRRVQKILAQREELFRSVANNIPVMLWTLDINEACNFMNKTRLQYTGRSIESEMGNGWMEDIHPDELHQVQLIYSRNFQTRKPFLTEYRLRRYDGMFRWVTGEGNPNYTADGVFSGFIIYCIDIHEKKVAGAEIESIVEVRTRELQVALNNLSSSNAELTQFAYAASHDLQEPVRKILTFSERIQLSGVTLSEDNERSLSKIERSAERMRTLIQDLLNLTKLSLVERHFQAVDLNKILAAVLEDFDVIIEEKKATVQIGKLPIVNGLGIQLHQLFHNLVSNAFKFAVPGKPLVIDIHAAEPDSADEAMLKNLNSPSNFVKIIVQDNGMGFNQEFADEIFTIFKRLNPSKDNFPGSGIGLSLCKKIALNHNGLIYATSEPGLGACLSLLIPAADNLVLQPMAATKSE